MYHLDKILGTKIVEIIIYSVIFSFIIFFNIFFYTYKSIITYMSFENIVIRGTRHESVTENIDTSFFLYMIPLSLSHELDIVFIISLLFSFKHFLWK